MADGDEGIDEVEAPEEDIDGHEAALLHISRYCELRRALPWDQWTFREKANYVLDRLFLGFLAIFLLMLFGECSYKIWYVTNVRKIAAFVWSSSVWLFRWLFIQEDQEELMEL